MPAWFTPELPERRQTLRNLVVEVTQFVAQYTTADERELRDQLVNAASSLLVAATIAGATDSAKGDPMWSAALSSQKDTP